MITGTEILLAEELSPEGEAMRSSAPATMAALKILVVCLQSNGALSTGNIRSNFG
jgi:hypothetical protein